MCGCGALRREDIGPRRGVRACIGELLIRARACMRTSVYAGMTAAGGLAAGGLRVDGVW